MSKEVAILLKLVSSPDNQSVADAVADLVKDAQEGASKEVTTGLSAREKALKGFLDRMSELEKKSAEDSTALAKRTAEEKARAEQEALSKQLKAVQDAARKEKELNDQRKKDAEQRQKDLDELSGKYAAAMQERDEANQKVTESGLKALQGTMDLAEGAAILGLAGEEDLEKFARGFVKIQAGFKMVKGGVDIIVGLAEGWRAVTKGAQAATLAQNAAAAASARAGAAGLASAGAGGAGAAGAAGAAGGAAGAGAFGSVASAGAWVVGIAAASLAVEEVFMGVAKSAGLVDETFLEAVISWRKAAADLKKSEADVERKQDELWAARQRRASQRGDFSLDDLRADRATLGMSDEQAAAYRSRQMDQQYGSAQQDYLDASSKRFNAPRDELIGIVETQSAYAKNLEMSARRRVESERELLRLAKDTVEARKSERDALVQSTAEIDRQIAAEKQRQQSGLAAFGRLGAGEQEQLKAISGKIQNGQELTAGEAEFLESTGFGRRFSEQYYAGQGERAGGQEVFDILEEGASTMAELEQVRAENAARMIEVEKQLGDAKAEVTRRSEQLARSFDDLVKAVERTVDILNELEIFRNNTNENSVGSESQATQRSADAAYNAQVSSNGAGMIFYGGGGDMTM